jgi:predicted acetyltransferase
VVRYREYTPQKDRESVHRIWREIGWLQEGQEEAADFLIGGSRATVAEVQGEAECLVATVPGTMRYMRDDLPFSCVASVGTSRIARKRGLAKGLTAAAIAHDAAQGKEVCGLGMFEQGFYNLLGFGTGCYEKWAALDPKSIRVKTEASIPSRLTGKDWEKVHQSRINRIKGHGACNLHAPQCTRAEMIWLKNSFGLGYFENGQLTHHIWFNTEKVERGPYNIEWMAFQTYQQFCELVALIKTLEDQVHLVTLREPPSIQVQDLLASPFRIRQVTEKSVYENRMQANAYWQMRILNLEECMEKTHLPGGETCFNLVLSDPIETMVPADAAWKGISGRYKVKLGPCSHAEKGKDENLPTLKATVGAFTRLWLGVRPASSLAATDEVYGSQELLEDLDRVLCIPEPHPDWDF